jgi:hypothetical protein
MGFFDSFRKRSGKRDPQSLDLALCQELVELVLGFVRGPDGRIRVEDAISAAATIVGERCIDATGDFPLRDHGGVPGSRFFSTRANVLICGDMPAVSQVPKDSIVGVLRSRLDPGVYADADFPALSEVFRQYAARLGNPADWGRVPLSVEQEHLPFLLPMRVGFETRGRVDEILRPIHEDRVRCLRIATECLAEILMRVASVIDHRLALMLAIETVNGMAKTTPMTAKRATRDEPS